MSNNFNQNTMKIKLYIKIVVIAIIAFSCTDLSEEYFDVMPFSEYGKTPNEIKTISGSAYSSLRGFKDDISNAYPVSEYVFFLQECVSDEACIPTRGTDWGDEGRYIEAHQHDLKPNNAMVLSTWRYCYNGISTCNFVIEIIDNGDLSTDDKEIAMAEIRGIRAYYYYLLVDMFGNVPITTSANDTAIATAPRADVYDFVETELLDIVDKLQPGKEYGRFTQNVANTLLARLYINSEVFIGTPRWQDCIDACNKVTGYSLEASVKDNWLIENQGSDEIIFAIPYDNKEGTEGHYLNSMTYHYNQRQAFSATSGGWQWSANGICAQPGVYSSFEPEDERIACMTEGIQYNLATGEAITMDDGSILDYTEEITNFYDAPQNEGVRLSKLEVREDEQWERDHDWVLMRYAEVMMMKAECLLRLGNAGAAQSLVTEIRGRSNLAPLGTLTLEALDTEWLHEFLFEGIRRNVNIRFGTYFKPWWEKGITPANKGIFPIPQSELSKNPLLVQNPGY